MFALLQRAFLLVFPFLWKDKSSKVATATTLLIILISTLAHTAAPWLFGQLIKFYNNSNPAYVSLITTLLILCWGIRLTLSQLRHIVFFKVVNQAIRDIRMQVIMQLHRVPLEAWEGYGTIEIISANTRVSMSIRNFMHISFVAILPALFKISTFSIAMLHVNLCTWYFPPLVILTYGYVYFGMQSFLRSRYKLWEATDQVRTIMVDSLHNTKFSRFHLDTEEARLNKFFDTEAKRWFRNNAHQYTIHLIQGALFILTAGGLIIHLVILLRAGQLTIPDFVIIKGYIFSIYTQAFQVTSHIRRLLSSVIDLKKVLDILALPTQHASAVLPMHTPISTIQEQPILQAQDISFAYKNSGTAILKNISLNIFRGDRVAITGTSGTGKSTLCHLLSGIYQPLQGAVLLYGRAMQHLSLSTIGRYVHFISQEAAIMTGSIADNLMAVPQTAQVMPLGYLKDRMNQSAGDEGKKLSGGEKQRILIARCLTYKPEVLILDEALSVLDETSAQDLLKMILAQVPTVILVTHRQSFLKEFEHIYHLKEGKLVAT
ncbi:MAG: ABC transporter ATP-binding protein [Bacteroidota bacterium]